jgi:predicted  nucleic acid-binding Zn-ribbon protein
MSFVCLECGYKFRSAVTAENAAFRDGCPSCGGTDIDLDVNETRQVPQK